MMNLLRAFYIQSRRNTGLLLLPLMVLIAWYVIQEYGPDTMFLWPEMSEAIRQSVIVLGPLMAGLAAWTADRDRTQGMRELLVSTSRPPAVRDLTVWAATTFWGAFAYVAVAVGAGIQTYRETAWGEPILWPIVVGLIGLVACSAIGFTIGSLIPSRFTSPLVAIVVFLALVFPSSRYADSGMRYLTPISTSPITDVFFGVRPNVGVELTLWLVGLTGTALAITALRHDRTVPHLTALGIGLVLSVTGGTMLGRTGSTVISDQDIAPYTPICEDQGIQVCVHPAYGAMLPEMASAIGAVMDPLVGLPGAPLRAEQRPRFSTIRPDQTFGFYLNSSLDGEDVVASMVRSLVGEDGTCGMPTTFENGQVPSDFVARNAIGGWLMQRGGFALGAFAAFPGVQDVMEHFSRLDAGIRHQWLAENLADLRKCQIGVEDLP